MTVVTNAFVNFLIVLAVGIVVGLVFNRYGRSWLGRKVTDATGVGDITHALIGVAGSFIGYHIAVILGLLPSPLMLYLGALIGALVVLWAWRGR